MRILTIDDEQAILDAYRHILVPASDDQSSALDALGDALFDTPDEAGVSNAEPVEISYCRQGLDAVAEVEAAVAAGRPFQVAFLDIRMPPGIDGKETARRIRAADPDINLVIVSAYSDHDVTDISLVAGPPDKIFYISKPFSADEIQQMAVALSRRWDVDARQIQLLREKIDELAESEARARHAALHDFLTGAPNRLAFQQMLNAKVHGCDKRFALGLIDLDRFKIVNDTFGHGAGDHLLQTIYESIREEVPVGTLVARLGGDEFGVVLEMASVEDAEDVCRRIIARCAGHFMIYGNSVQVGASIGMLWAEDFPDRDANDALRFADIALYEAKRRGRQQYCRFDAAMDASTKFRQTIEVALRHAVANDELTVHYQPIIERDSLVPIGFEALLRWHSPVHGEIPPAVFIPIAEETALIHQIGDWVLERALTDSRSWPEFITSINFSPAQFKRPDFISSIRETATRLGAPFDKIQIEVTETAMFDDIDRASSTLAELQSLGFRVALDDFGTGYSNLLSVKNFALDCIKIDKSFVDGLGVESDAAAIVNSITQLARGLGLNVIAEGVETDVQCQALRVIGCSHMQGYLFGKGVPLAQTSAYYLAGRAGVSMALDTDEAAASIRLKG